MQKHPTDKVFRTPLSRWAGRLGFSIRSIVTSNMMLRQVHYQTFIRWTEFKNRRKGLPSGDAVRVTDRTELVIDGFQGSANSFATAAFKSSQTRQVNLCHHLHAPVLVIEAVRRGLPVIITIRTPREAVLSLVSRWEYLAVEQGLKGYIRYYRALLPYLDRIVVSNFKQTTGDFGSVIAMINERWELSFEEFKGEEEDVVKVRDMSERKRLEKVHREEVKSGKTREFDTRRCQHLLKEAEAIFQLVEGRS